jgi:alpha-L-fucosidase
MEIENVSGDAILKQTVDPDPGYAVKEVFFTKKGNNIYAIMPRYPKNKLC